MAAQVKQHRNKIFIYLMSHYILKQRQSKAVPQHRVSQNFCGISGKQQGEPDPSQAVVSRCTLAYLQDSWQTVKKELWLFNKGKTQMFYCSKIWEVDTFGRKISQISNSTVWEKQSQAFFPHAGTLFRGDKWCWAYLSPEGCDQSTPDINAAVLYCPFISYIPLASTENTKLLLFEMPLLC